MNVKPYHTARPKKDEVREMFDRIAPRYDLLNHLLSLGIDRWWRRRVVAVVASLVPRKVLDVATGTGDLAIALARRLGDAEVVGVDLSEEMLRAARRKVEARGLAGRVTLAAGDAERLPLPDAAFDVATVAFGVRNFDDLAAGLGELARTIKPGGAAVILEFSRPDIPIFRTLYGWYSRLVLPRIGGAVSRDRRAYDYLPASVEAFPAPEAFMAQMRGAGFACCSQRRLTGGITRIYIARR